MLCVGKRNLALYPSRVMIFVKQGLEKKSWRSISVACDRSGVAYYQRRANDDDDDGDDDNDERSSIWSLVINQSPYNLPR